MPGWNHGLAWTGVVMLALGLSCSSSTTAKAQLGGACTTNSDCIDDLVCSSGHCYRPCKTASDCPTGACMNVGGVVNVCQF
jgi:hypothetical protein